MRGGGRMEISKTLHLIIKWTARILAAAVTLFGLPFYFGYGNPLPFTKPGYTFYDNAWLIVFPLMFIGLIIGWIWPKIGGFLVVIPILFGFAVTLVAKFGIPIHMLVPLFVGVLYLLTGFTKSKQ